MPFRERYHAYLQKVNDYLDRQIAAVDGPEGELFEAMRYSLMAGGKRIRPILTLCVSDMLGGSEQAVMPFACAIEMIHTSALIHDDLIDNDHIRRGRPANHVKFGMKTAILAGDALLNYAYEHMIDILRQGDATGGKLKAIAFIMNATGAYGMMGGQMIDCASENKRIDIDTLQRMHHLKTGAIIKAAILSAAWISEAPASSCDKLEQLSEWLGQAFQIKDDILDFIGNEAVMGKNTGGDIANRKRTFVTLLGIDQSNRMLDECIAQSLRILDGFDKEDTRFLKQLVLYIKERDH